MSEDEIMQGINTTIAFMKEELKAEHSCFTIKELWALNGLLDLYQKEKEKNKELEEENTRQHELLGNIHQNYRGKIAKIQEQNKEIVDTQYISKDKIRKCIQTPYPEVAIENIVELLEENNGKQM